MSSYRSWSGSDDGSDDESDESPRRNYLQQQQQVPLHYPLTDEIDWNRPRHLWTIHQEQTYFNMFGHVASPSFSIYDSTDNPLHARRRHETTAEDDDFYDSFAMWDWSSSSSHSNNHIYAPEEEEEEEEEEGSVSLGNRGICVICQCGLNEREDDDGIITLEYCGHKFHMNCIQLWFPHRNACPLCNSIAPSRF